jgi:hypothetical protein
MQEPECSFRRMSIPVKNEMPVRVDYDMVSHA